MEEQSGQARRGDKRIPRAAQIADRLPILPREQVIFRLLSLAKLYDQLAAFFCQGHYSAFPVFRLAGVKADRVIQQVYLRAAHPKQFGFPESVSVGQGQEAPQSQMKDARCVKRTIRGQVDVPTNDVSSFIVHA